MNEPLPMGRRLRIVLHALRLRGPLAGDPTARMLHAFLASLVCWHLVWSALLASRNPMPPARWGALVIQFLLPLGSLVLLRLGFLRRASLFYLAGASIFATYQVAFNGGIHSPLLAHYVAVPIMATWLLSFRGALWTLIACMSGLLGICPYRGGGYRSSAAVRHAIRDMGRVPADCFDRRDTSRADSESAEQRASTAAET